MERFARHYAAHFKRAAGFRGAVGSMSPYLLGAGGAAGNYLLADSMGYGPYEKTIAVLGGAGAGHHVGGFVDRHFNPHSLPAGATAPRFDFKKDVVFPGMVAEGGVLGLHTLRENATLAKAQTEAITGQHGEAPAGTVGALDYLKSHAGDIGKGVGLTALGGAGLYALVQAARAAKRLGDGHAIRVSTSLRKRPGQSTDLNLGLTPLAAGRLGRGGRTRPGEGDDAKVDEGTDAED